jgi:hypothetical protein
VRVSKAGCFRAFADNHEIQAPIKTGAVDDDKGTASVRQTTFGIIPVSVAAGTIKVKDDVSIQFEIVTRSSAAPER